MKHLKVLLLVYFLFGCISMQAETPLTTNPDKQMQQVLLLSSYNQSNEWSSKIEKSLVSYFLAKDETIIQSEYLDIHAGITHEELEQKAHALIEMYKEKNKITILLGEDAWIFYRYLLGNNAWKDTPCIALFSGTYTIGLEDYLDNKEIKEASRITLEESRAGMNATILYDPIFVKENISLMQSLQTGIENIAFISDYRQVSAVMREKMESTLHEHFPHLRFINLSMKQINTEQLKDSIRHLPPHTGILFHSWYLPWQKHRLSNSANNMKQIISKLVRTPVFTLYDAGVENGFICGGHYITTQQQSEILYETLTRIMNGTKASDIPVTNISHAHTYLNYHKLTTYNIPERLYPKDAIYYEKPVDVFEKNKEAIILIIIIAGLVICIISMAIVNQNRKLKNSQRIKEALEKSDRIKSAFIANMSHKVRTPLNAIAGFSDLMADSEKMTPEERKEYADIIQYNKNQLLNLFNDIIELSSIEAGTMLYTSSPTNVSDIIHETVGSIKHETGLTVNFDRQPVDCVIHSDRPKFVKIIKYLVAVIPKKFGGENLLIEYELPEKDKKHVHFYIRFCGTPLRGEEKKRLFDKFYDSEQDMDIKSDLELPLCKAYIEMMGGEIELLESGKNERNMAFRFKLPVTATEEDSGRN